MARYCVNKNAQSGGEHEVHNLNVARGCLPDPQNRQDLGFHSNCASALTAARRYYSNVDGCAHCTPECHTR